MNELLERIESALDEVRPHLRVDGGDIEVLEITPDNRLIVRWLGNCGTCTMSAMTLKVGWNRSLKPGFPRS